MQECLPCLKKIQDGTFNTMTVRGRGSILKSRLSTNAVTNDMKLMNIAITHMKQAMPQPNSNRCQATGGDQQGLYGRLIRKTAGRIRQTQICHTLESHTHACQYLYSGCPITRTRVSVSVTPSYAGEMSLVIEGLGVGVRPKPAVRHDASTPRHLQHVTKNIREPKAHKNLPSAERQSLCKSDGVAGFACDQQPQHRSLRLDPRHMREISTCCA